MNIRILWRTIERLLKIDKSSRPYLLRHLIEVEEDYIEHNRSIE